MAQSPSQYEVKRYGWVRDLPDHRDVAYAAPPEVVRALPGRVDLRPQLAIAAYDQGALGSCTANAIAAAVQFARGKGRELPEFVPSRLFIYFNERVIERTVEQDSGAQLRDGMKAVAKLGVCPESSSPASESDWPYAVERFAARPPAAAFRFGEAHQVLSYRRIPQTLAQLEGCLASGFPFVFGFTVYESFESSEVARSGVVNLPRRAERPVGGHAVLAMGYDEATRRFLVRNSWGPGWGQQGYFTMPYAYLVDPDLAADFWTVRQVEA